MNKEKNQELIFIRLFGQRASWNKHTTHAVEITQLQVSFALIENVSTVIRIIEEYDTLGRPDRGLFLCPAYLIHGTGFPF